MKTVQYSTIERGVARNLQLDADNLDAVEFADIRDAISEALEEAWRFAFWKDLVRTQQRRYRAAYDSGTAYAASDEVYHIASDAYYQAVKATTGNDPATETDGEWEVDDAHWALAERTYDGDEYDAATAYVAGDQVYYPTTGLFYQCHTAATGAAPTDTSKWGVLTSFHPYIDYTQADETPIGDLEGVYQSNPEQYPGAVQLQVDRTNLGIEPREIPAPTQPWVRFLTRPPDFTGEAWDATVSYEVAESGDPGSAAASIPEDLSVSGRLDLPEVKAYTLVQYATSAGSITAFTAKLGSGTATVRVTIDGVVVAGLTGLSLTTSESTSEPTGDGTEAFEIGQTIVLQVTAVSSPEDLDFTLAMSG